MITVGGFFCAANEFFFHKRSQHTLLRRTGTVRTNICYTRFFTRRERREKRAQTQLFSLCVPPRCSIRSKTCSAPDEAVSSIEIRNSATSLLPDLMVPNQIQVQPGGDSGRSCSVQLVLEGFNFGKPRLATQQPSEAGFPIVVHLDRVSVSVAHEEHTSVTVCGTVAFGLVKRPAV